MAEQPDPAPAPAPEGAKASPTPPKKEGFFSGLGGFGAPKTPAVGTQQVADLATDINNASTRLRILEERYENLRKKILVIEQNMLQNNKKVMTEVRASDEQIKDFGHVIEQMKEELKLIIRELKLTAKSDEMMQLKKYISVWEPLNFVTREEAKKMIADIIEEKIPELAEEGFFEEEINKAMNNSNKKKSK